MKDLIKFAKQLIMEGKVKQTSKRTWDVNENIVIHKIKKGRNIMSCSCQNYARFVNENPICSHKIAVILFKTNKKFIEKLDKLINQYEKWKELKFKPQLGMFVDDLNKIKKEV